MKCKFHLLAWMKKSAKGQLVKVRSWRFEWLHIALQKRIGLLPLTFKKAVHITG
jgi:hypothetical protein